MILIILIFTDIKMSSKLIESRH